MKPQTPLIFLLASLLILSPTLRGKENSFLPPAFREALLRQSDGKLSSFVAHSSKVMISSESSLASEAAKKVFQQGGNLVDAAVALSFVLAVHKPESTGLGGGGFLIFYSHKEKKSYGLDMREQAPLAAHRDMYLRKGKYLPHLSRFGGLSVATPGLVAGLYQIHKKLGSGKVSWESLLQPALGLAEKGFPVSPYMAHAVQWLSRSPAWKYPRTRHLLSRKDGTPLREGDVYRNPSLANTLRALAKKGPRCFYQGEIAKKIVKTIQREGGRLSLQDLQDYRPRFRRALKGTYGDYTLITMPPPSSGGVHLLQMFNMLQSFKLGSFSSPQTLHLKGEIMKRAFRDRAKYLGDPDFFAVPVRGLTSPKYGRALALKISLTRALPSSRVTNPSLLPFQKENTTHFSIIDGEGNGLVSTQTINYLFGSGLLAEDTGIFLNNEMDDFSARPGEANVFGLVGGEANAIAPRKRPLSSMSPTIVLKKGRIWLALGSPGGSKIITSVWNVLVNLMEHKMSLPEAVFAPRIHHQWLPDCLYLEEKGFSDSVVESLKKQGHRVILSSRGIGCISAVMEEGKNKKIGVADPRRGGKAVGY